MILDEQMSLFEEGEIIEQRKSILMCIHDNYFDRMVKGTKHYEYRFTFTKNKTRAYIYIPRVEKHIVGYIDLGRPSWEDVKKTCKIYTESDNGDYKDMESWLAGKEGCYVIPIENIFIYERPVTLAELLSLDPEFNAPQSFMYLHNKKNLLNLLENRQVRQNY
jgi:predicted transcriptional regulator